MEGVGLFISPFFLCGMLPDPNSVLTDGTLRMDEFIVESSLTSFSKSVLLDESVLLGILLL